MSTSQHPDRRNNRVFGTAQLIGCNTDGTIYNLSTEGAGFSINRNFQRYVVNQTYTLILKFQESEEFPEGVAIECTGLVRYKEYDENSKLMKIGIEFDSISESNQQKINRMVAFLEEANVFWGL